jgi:Copper transport outer membrane protein, MctB
MFDFRYHALSLVAVFLALGIGIVLGASLGDSVISQANKDVRSSLRNDVVTARQDARTAKAAVSNRDDFIQASFKRLAGGKLRGKRIAIVSLGPLPQDLESDVRAGVKDAGGRVDSVARFDVNPDLLAIGGKLGSHFQLLGTNPGQLRPLGRRLGRALASGRRPALKLESAFPDDFSGDYRGADAVVLYRADGKREDASERFDAALVEGLRDTGLPVVGIERSDEDPSQIPFYVHADLSTVDDADQPAGRVALVLALDGANGNFGFKSTADAPLPSGKR